MSEMLDKEDPGPTYAEIQEALNAAEATITSLRAELERKDAALRWYGEKGNYRTTITEDRLPGLPLVVQDGGKVARAAISAQKEEEA